MPGDSAIDEQRILDDLRRLIGTDNVVADEDARADAMVDALGGYRGDGIAPAVPPAAVVRPTSTEDVSAIVRYARDQRIPMVPHGGGTGLMGGARSVRSGIVVDLTRMARVRSIDAVSRFVWVDAGATLRSVDDALREHGLMIGHDPWTFDIATVGGAISTNGLGFLGGKYGSMGDQTLALEAVLADGSVIETRPVEPHSTGLDVRSLFIGAEGQFGIITAAALRVYPIPESRERAGFRFATFEAGFQAILDVYRVGLAPALLDFGDRPLEGDRQATLYVGFEGVSEEIAGQMARAERILTAGAGAPVDRREVEEFWSTRHEVAENFVRARRQRAQTAQRRRAFDYAHVSLPPSRVLQYRSEALGLARDMGALVVETGVWVSPGLFSLVFVARDESDEGAAGASRTVDACLRLASEHRGSVEYCHGVGLRLAHLMHEEHGRGLDVMRVIKRALDPDGVMNPGKAALS